MHDTKNNPLTEPLNLLEALPYLTFPIVSPPCRTCKIIIELHKNNDRVHTLTATSAINQLLLNLRAIVPMKTAGEWLFTKF